MASPARKFRDKVQQDHPGSVVIERGKNFIKQLTPNGLNILDTSLGPIHYGAGLDQEIDTEWIDSVAPWDKEMTKADFNLFALTDFSSGQVVKYVHPESGQEITFEPQQLQFTNDLDQIQPVGDVQAVTAFVDDDELQWSGAFGSGLDFVWEAQTARLSKRLTVQNLSAIGTPEQYIVDGGNPMLRLQFIFQLSTGVDIYIDDELWDKNSTQDTDKIVEFRDSSTGDPLWWFGYAQAEDQETKGIVCTQRYKKIANNLFVEIRVPWSWLENAVYPVTVDPTIDPQVGASEDDCFVYPSTITYVHTSFYIGNDGAYNNAGFRIALSVPQNSSIISSYLTFTANSELTADTVRIELSYQDANSPGNFSGDDETSFNARTRSPTTVTWDFTDDWTSESEYESPSLNTMLEALFIESYWDSGDYAVIFLDDDSSDAYRKGYSYDGSTTKCAVLHIEYASDLSIDIGLDEAAYQGTGVRILP